MFKDELKNLSEEIFFDNEHGGITPQEQRHFYSELIDKVVTIDEVKEMDLTDIQSDIIPSGNFSQDLGSTGKGWKNLHVATINTSQVNGVPITTASTSSRFLAGDGSYKEINSGWNEIQTGASNQIWINIGWAIVADMMVLQGTLTIPAQVQPIVELPTIPSNYLNRIKTETVSLYTPIKKGNTLQYAQIGLQVRNEKLILTLQPSEVAAEETTIYFSPFFIPLTPEIRVEIGEESHVDYSEWDYSEIEVNNTRWRMAYPWTQKKYSDQTTGLKIYGESFMDREEAGQVNVEKSEWIYTQAEDKMTCNRTREVQITWSFTSEEYTLVRTESVTVGVSLVPAGNWQYDKLYQEGYRYTNTTKFGYDFGDYIHPAGKIGVPSEDIPQMQSIINSGKEPIGTPSIPEEPNILPAETYKEAPLSISEGQYYIYNIEDDTICSSALYTFRDEIIDGREIILPHEIYLKSDSSLSYSLPAGATEISLGLSESSSFLNIYFNAFDHEGINERNLLDPDNEGFIIASCGIAGAYLSDETRWDYINIDKDQKKIICKSYEDELMEEFSGRFRLKATLSDYKARDISGKILFELAGSKTFEVNAAREGEIAPALPPAIWFKREPNRFNVNGDLTVAFTLDNWKATYTDPCRVIKGEGDLIFAYTKPDSDPIKYNWKPVNLSPTADIKTVYTSGYIGKLSAEDITNFNKLGTVSYPLLNIKDNLKITATTITVSRVLVSIPVNPYIITFDKTYTLNGGNIRLTCNVGIKNYNNDILQSGFSLKKNDLESIIFTNFNRPPIPVIRKGGIVGYFMGFVDNFLELKTTAVNKELPSYKARNVETSKEMNIYASPAITQSNWAIVSMDESCIIVENRTSGTENSLVSGANGYPSITISTTGQTEIQEALEEFFYKMESDEAYSFLYASNNPLPEFITNPSKATDLATEV